MKTEELRDLITRIVREQVEAVRNSGQHVDDPVIRLGTINLGDTIAANINGNLMTTKQGSVIDLASPAAPWKVLSPEMENFAKAFRELVQKHETRLLQENSDPSGGYLVPEEFQATMVQYDTEPSCIWPRATIWPMTTDKLGMPKLAQRSDADAADWDHFAGVIFTWTEEGHAKTETEPDFEFLELIAHELSGYTAITDILIEDSAINLMNFLTGLFRRAYLWFTDRSFFRGNGARQPMGIILDPAVLMVNRTTAGAVTYQDILAMDDKLPSVFDQGAVWFGSKAVFNSLRNERDNNGALVLQQFYQPGPPGVGQKLVEYLAGYPAIRSDQKTMPIGVRGDLILCNPAWYYVGDRKRVTIDISKHYLFRDNKTAMRVTGRVDGQCAIPEAFVVLDVVTTGS